MRFMAIVTAAMVMAASPAMAQAPQSKVAVSIAMADAMIPAARAEAARQGHHVTIVILDEAGQLAHVTRMDGAPATSIELARRKALTALISRQPSRVVAENYAKGSTEILAIEGMLPIAGGLPLLQGRTVIGAIGVSGSPADVDEAIAKAALAALTR